MRPPAGFTGADAEEPAEETAVPRQADRDRLIQRVAASAAEMPDRIVALTALAADEVAGVAAGRRFHRARRLTWAGNRGRDGRGPARDRLAFRGGRQGGGGGGGGGGGHPRGEGGAGGGGA